MQFDEQQEPTFSAQDSERPPALAGVPIRVSYEDPHPPAQRLPKKRLATVTAAALALVLFGIVWRTMRKPDDAPPPARGESVFTEQQRTGQNAVDDARQVQQQQREHVAETQRALEGDFTSVSEEDGGS